jgi:hypothetical protein
MTVNQLCARAGVTRQWINHCVDSSGIPGVTRKANGRLKIIDGPQLDQWIDWKSTQTKEKRSRRMDLKSSRAVIAQPENETSYTSRELAQRIGCTVSSINQRVTSIPGAYSDGLRYLFADSPELQQWIEHEKALDRRPDYLKFAGNIDHTRAAFNRLLRDHPLNDWSMTELVTVGRAFGDLLDAFDKLKVEAEKRQRTV